MESLLVEVDGWTHIRARLKAVYLMIVLEFQLQLAEQLSRLNVLFPCLAGHRVLLVHRMVVEHAKIEVILWQLRCLMVCSRKLC